MELHYSVEHELTAGEFQSILIRSTLAERRPVQDLARLDAMLRQADLVITARVDDLLIGISRAITDFSYCCYLSDLAVDVEHQRRGVGRRLIKETHKAAGMNTTLILIAAPAAESYYPRIGMTHVPSCWIIPRQ